MPWSWAQERTWAAVGFCAGLVEAAAVPDGPADSRTSGVMPGAASGCVVLSAGADLLGEGQEVLVSG